MNALFLKDLADKTHRGLRGRVEHGKSGGGISYGYRVARASNGATVVTGDRDIEPTEAAVVERIFRDFAAGRSPKEIVKTLNREGVPGPSGRKWNPSTLQGNRERGTGILNNELYIGKMIWNRMRYVKNPDTGKRVSRLNPAAEWVTDRGAASSYSLGRRVGRGQATTGRHREGDSIQRHTYRSASPAISVFGADEMRGVWGRVHHGQR